MGEWVGRWADGGIDGCQMSQSEIVKSSTEENKAEESGVELRQGWPSVFYK